MNDLLSFFSDYHSNKDVAFAINASEATYGRWINGKSKLTDEKYIFALETLREIMLNANKFVSDSFLERAIFAILAYRSNSRCFLPNAIFGGKVYKTNINFLLNILVYLYDNGISFSMLLNKLKENKVVLDFTKLSERHWIYYGNAFIFKDSDKKEMFGYVKDFKEKWDYSLDTNSSFIYLIENHKVVYSFPDPEKNTKPIIDDIPIPVIQTILFNISFLGPFQNQKFSEDDISFLVDLFKDTKTIDNLGLLYIYKYYSMEENRRREKLNK